MVASKKAQRLVERAMPLAKRADSATAVAHLESLETQLEGLLGRIERIHLQLLVWSERQLAEEDETVKAAVALAIAARRRFWPERRLAAYLALYALVRFALEFLRLHPPIAFGLSWYQFLALALFGLAGATWWRRRAIADAALLR